MFKQILSVRWSRRVGVVVLALAVSAPLTTPVKAESTTADSSVSKGAVRDREEKARDGKNRKKQEPFSKTLGPDVNGAKRRGTYIVTTKDSTRTSLVLSQAKNAGVRSTHTFNSVFNGFAARLSQEQMKELRKNPNVINIAPDRRASVLGTQTYGDWHLDRLDNDRRDEKFSFSKTGTGVSIYVVDTGIRKDHVEFTGRIPRGYDAISQSNTTYDDCNGHGTHVAGLAAGSTYGVAKGARIIPVKVLDCSGYGSVSDIIRGLTWIKDDVTANPGPAVVNMSLGVESDSSLNTAVQSLITAGITVVAAAGNETANACTGPTALSPAQVDGVITVGGLGEYGYEEWDNGYTKDEIWWNSNYGSCVDVYGPSEYMRSSWNSSFAAENRISGTSMASPLAAGVVAVHLQDSPTAIPSAVHTSIVNASVKNMIDSRSYPNADTTTFNNRALRMVTLPTAGDAGDSRETATPIEPFYFYTYEDEEDPNLTPNIGETEIRVSTVGATYDSVNDPGNIANTHRTTWARIVATQSGTLTINSSFSDPSFTVGVYSGGITGALTNVGTRGSLPLANTNVISLVKGQNYYIVFGKSGAQDFPSLYVSLSLDVTAPSNVQYSTASSLAFSLPIAVTASNTPASIFESQSTEIFRNAVWYKFTTPSGSAKRVSIDTNGSDFDTAISLVAADDTRISNDNFGGVTWSRVTHLLQPSSTYWIEVGSNDRSDFGSFTLNIREVTIPVNDSAANATLVTIGSSFVVNGSNVNADQEYLEENHLIGFPDGGGGGGCSKAKPMCALSRSEMNQTSGASVWWKFSPSVSGRITINTSGSDFDTVLALYRQVDDSDYLSREYQTGDFDSCSAVPQCTPASASVVVRAGFTYFLAVAGVAQPGQVASEGSITLNFSPRSNLSPPANDSISNAVSLNVSSAASVTGTVVDADVNDGNGFSQGVWYDFVAPTTGIAEFSVNSYDVILSGYHKNASSLVWRSYAWEPGGVIFMSVKAGERYYVEVSSWTVDAGSGFTLSYEPVVQRPQVINDIPELAQAIDVSSAGSADVRGASARYNLSSPLGDSYEASMYWTFVPTVSGSITFTSPNRDSLGIFSGTDGNYSVVTATYGFDGNYGPVTTTLTAGIAYTLVVSMGVNGSVSWTAVTPPAAPAPVTVIAATPAVAPVAPVVTAAPTPSQVVSPPSLLPSSAGTQVDISRPPSQALATDSAVAVKGNKVSVALMVPTSKNKTAQIVKYTIVLKPAKGKAITKNVTAKAGKKLSTSLSGAKGVKYKLVVTGLTKAGKKVVWNGPSITTPKK